MITEHDYAQELRDLAFCLRELDQARRAGLEPHAALWRALRHGPKLLTTAADLLKKHQAAAADQAAAAAATKTTADVPGQLTLDELHALLEQ